MLTLSKNNVSSCFTYLLIFTALSGESDRGVAGLEKISTEKKKKGEVKKKNWRGAITENSARSGTLRIYQNMMLHLSMTNFRVQLTGKLGLLNVE